MNRTILVGRLTSDPELKFTPQGTGVTKFTMAVNRMKKDEADFIRCVAFNKPAETIANYIRKGSQIAIEGRIQTGSYDDKDGKKIYTFDVIVDRFDFCGKSEGNASQAPKQSGADNDGYMPVTECTDEMIPF